MAQIINSDNLIEVRITNVGTIREDFYILAFMSIVENENINYNTIVNGNNLINLQPIEDDFNNIISSNNRNIGVVSLEGSESKVIRFIINNIEVKGIYSIAIEGGTINTQTLELQSQDILIRPNELEFLGFAIGDYFTDFRESNINTQPNNWEWIIGEEPEVLARIEENEEGTANKVLALSTQTTGFKFLRWNIPGQITNSKLTIKFKVEQPWSFFITGAVSRFNYINQILSYIVSLPYKVDHRNIQDLDSRTVLNGIRTDRRTLTIIPEIFETNSWYIFVLEVTNNNIRTKFWKENENEPNFWFLDYIQNEIPKNGYFGIPLNRDESKVLVDWINIDLL